MSVPLMVKIPLIFLAALIIVGGILFMTAGTLDYWQAWAYMGVLFIPASLVLMYFLKNDPKFLERRLRTKEKEAKQKLIIKIGMVIFIIGFLVPGLDQRLGWSYVPVEASVLADVIVLLGYLLVFLTFRENSYAGRTVQVEKGQKVISTGLYSVIRHPMYLGTLMMYLPTPIALGSYWALPPFLLFPAVILFRIWNEEEVLKRELPGYIEYCKKVKYRLIPLIW